MAEDNHTVLTDAARQSGDRLAVVVQELLNRGVSAEVVLEELESVRSAVPSEMEDDVLDVMDRVAGWCAPGARLTAEPEE